MRIPFRILVLLVLAGVAGSAASCDPMSGRGELLRYKTGDSNVWLIDTGSFDLTLELHVERAGRERSQFVIDKSEYATLRFIKYEGRVLAANGKYVFAAYDPAGDQIIAYDELTFTLWDGQGEVVASYRWGDGEARMRSGFPERRAGR